MIPVCVLSNPKKLLNLAQVEGIAIMIFQAEERFHFLDSSLKAVDCKLKLALLANRLFTYRLYRQLVGLRKQCFSYKAISCLKLILYKSVRNGLLLQEDEIIFDLHIKTSGEKLVLVDIIHTHTHARTHFLHNIEILVRSPFFSCQILEKFWLMFTTSARSEEVNVYKYTGTKNRPTKIRKKQYNWFKKEKKCIRNQYENKNKRKATGGGARTSENSQDLSFSVLTYRKMGVVTKIPCKRHRLRL